MASGATASTVAPAGQALHAERQPPPEEAGRGAAAGPALTALRPPASSPGTSSRVTARGASTIRVFIRHAAGTRNALPAIQLAAYLQTRGFAVAGIRAVDVPMERPRVRYFFAGDEPQTERLVETIDAFFAKVSDPAPNLAVDLSRLDPRSHRGDVEVWLPPPVADGSQST